MEMKIAKHFNERVHAILQENREKEKLYASLKAFHRHHDLKQLVQDLHQVINEPSRTELYEDLRPLIPLKQQKDYDRLIPCRRASDRLRVVRLYRKPNEGLGFTVRGGLEHGVGVYVSHVDPDSQAYNQGLRTGDEIVRVNGFTISQAIHDEVLSLIRAKAEIVLKVRRVGMIPVKDYPDAKLTWKYVEDLEEDTSSEPEEIHLCVTLPVGVALGCKVCCGPPDHPGIFIQSVTPDSLAQEVGLEVSDQIMQCNDTSFQHISHAQAVVALKGSRLLHLLIRKHAGAGLFPSRTKLTEEEEKAVRLQQLVATKQQETRGRADTNASGSTMKTEEVFLEPMRQEDIIMQALKVIEERNSTTSSVVSHPSTLVSQTTRTEEQPPVSDPSVIQPPDGWGPIETSTSTSVTHTSPITAPDGGGVSDDHIYAVIDRVKRSASSSTTGGSETVVSPGGIEKENASTKTAKEDNPIERPVSGSSEEAYLEYIHHAMANIDQEAEVFPKPQSFPGVVVRSSSGRRANPGASTYYEAGSSVHGTPHQSRRSVNMEEEAKGEPIRGPADIPVDVTQPVSIQVDNLEDRPKRTSKKPPPPPPPPVSPLYISDAKSPTFRIQKPVMLHPETMQSRDRVSPIAEEMMEEMDPHRIFTNEEIAGRQIQLVTIKKAGHTELGMFIEQTKKKNQPFTRILVAKVCEGEAVHKQGGIHVHDEIMRVNEHSLIGAPALLASTYLKAAFQDDKPTVQLIVAKAPPNISGEEITYF